MLGPPIMNLEVRKLKIYQTQNSHRFAQKSMVLLVENLYTID
jgi:hypothetical protein